MPAGSSRVFMGTAKAGPSALTGYSVWRCFIWLCGTGAARVPRDPSPEGHRSGSVSRYGQGLNVRRIPG